MRESRINLEQRILEVIFDHYFATGIPPTYREVSAATNTAPSNVWYVVQSLREGGFLRESPATSARSLLLSDAGVERVTNPRTSVPTSNRTSP